MYSQVMITVSKNKNIQVKVLESMGTIVVRVFEIKASGGEWRFFEFLDIWSFYIWLINQNWYNDKYTIDDLTNYFVSVPIKY